MNGEPKYTPTPRPWTMFVDDEPTEVTIDGPLVRSRDDGFSGGEGRELIAMMTNGEERNYANAALIIKAVNGREAIAEAWNNPGRDPIYHLNAQGWLERNWPTLARAIKQLLDDE